MNRRTSTWVAWVLLLACETGCQISLKSAGLDVGAFDFSRTAFMRALAEPWLWSAIGCYVGAFLSWITILRKSSLSAAFATSAIVFVAVMAASWLVFGEHVGLMQIVGSSIILAGILMLGADEAAETPAPSTAHPARGNLTHQRFAEKFMSSSVQETVFNIIAKEAGIDVQKITPESTLKELEIQSLDAVQIIFEIEDHYKITLPDRDPNFDTESVKGLVDAVEKLLAEKQAATPPV